jgi:hypothetical protein
MAKSDLLQVEGTVIDVGKGDLYTIKLTDNDVDSPCKTNEIPMNRGLCYRSGKGACGEKI